MESTKILVLNGPLEKAAGFGSAIREWARRLRPSEMASRLRDETLAAEAAHQILTASLAGRGSPHDDADAVIDSILSSYGEGPIRRAMLKGCWWHEKKVKTDGDTETAWRAATPAMVVSTLRSSKWAARLAEMVPAEHWAHRVKVSDMASLDAGQIGKLKALEIKTESFGPWLLFCANGPAALGEAWLGRLELLGSMMPAPKQAELHACRAMLSSPGGNRDPRKMAFEAWVERSTLSSSIEGPAAPDQEQRRPSRSL